MLMCDRRSRNAMGQCLAKARRPRPARLARIILLRPHVLRTSGRDLKDFYYIMEVDAVRMAKQP